MKTECSIGGFPGISRQFPLLFSRNILCSAVYRIISKGGPAYNHARGAPPRGSLQKGSEGQQGMEPFEIGMRAGGRKFAKRNRGACKGREFAQENRGFSGTATIRSSKANCAVVFANGLRDLLRALPGSLFFKFIPHASPDADG